MSSNWRRFEVLLPLQFNDGRDVPPEWLAEAVLEMVDHPLTPFVPLDISCQSLEN